MHDAFSDYKQAEQRQEEEQGRDSPVILILEWRLEEHHEPGAVR